MSIADFQHSFLCSILFIATSRMDYMENNHSSGTFKFNTSTVTVEGLHRHFHDCTKFVGWSEPGIKQENTYLKSSEVRAVTDVSPELKAVPAAELSPLLLPDCVHGSDTLSQLRL
jgi:hypothetical protein